MRLHAVVAVAFAPDPLPEEGNVTYAVTVTNNGPDTATGVQVVVPSPPSSIFGFTSASASQGSVSLGAATP
jgi:uncharacterized repeat protein (TIGR01451 family)